MAEQQDEAEEGVLLRQTLMSHDECFVYKVPPLAVAAGGYKANDWNLATPLKTCGFQVERRNNDLYLLFTLENHTKLFCVSKIEYGSAQNQQQRSIETVSDSSRYFVCKIQQGGTGRTMNLGFGFRDRDIALDLLGNIQQFRQSIDRELEAKELASKIRAIPKLASDEKMHITIPGGKSPKPKKRPASKSTGGAFLLKKPPPSADAVAAPLGDVPSNNKTYGKRFSMSSMECPLKEMTLSIHKTENSDGIAGDDNSTAAVGNRSIDSDSESFLSLQEAPVATDADDGIDQEFENDDVADDLSEDAVGGGTSTVVGVADDDSFQFSELNLDDLDETCEETNKDTTSAVVNEEANEGVSDDDGFGDFQEA